MSFGTDPRQRLTAFIPKEPSPGPWVYFLFGGSWMRGSVRTWSFVGNWFAHHGIPAVLGGYRLAPGHRFPAAFDDALAGYAFSLRHAEELGIEGRAPVLSGASSGGHLAALVALALARDGSRALDSEAVDGASGLLLVNAAVDLMSARTRGGEAAIEALTGHGRPWPEADPLTLAASATLRAEAIPRTMLVQGEVDELVTPSGARAFADALNAVAPGKAEVVGAPWRTHVELTRLFLDRDPRLTTRVVDWLRAIGAPQPPAS